MTSPIITLPDSPKADSFVETSADIHVVESSTTKPKNGGKNKDKNKNKKSSSKDKNDKTEPTNDKTKTSLSLFDL